MADTFDRKRSDSPSTSADSPLHDQTGPSSPGPGLLDGAAARLGAGVVQRKIQRRALSRRAADAPPAPGDVHETAALGTSGAAGPLPHLSEIQRSFGAHDVTGVRAHGDDQARQASVALGASAYAFGDDVAFVGAPSLHTAAHEAAHVVQQRTGVHLQGDVGQVGDPYEQHADAVADLVVQGKSAEAALSQQAGPARPAGASSAVQRASDYDGVMPAHETWGESYTFKGEKNTEFTYHHIIPENKLKLVTKELKAIKGYYDTLEATDENATERGKAQTLDTGTGALITEAKKGWLETRIKNTTHEINHAYDIYGIEVTESEVRAQMENKGETIALLFPIFRDFLKLKVQARHTKASQAVSRNVADALKDPGFYHAVNNADQAGIEDGLARHLDTKIYDKTYAGARALGAVQQVRQGQKHGQLNKATLRDEITKAIQARDFDAFYRDVCPKLYEDNTSTDQHLKKVVQMNALPHDDDAHLGLAVQWNPGNIHRGPSSSKRLNPADQGFVEKLDDGGDTFEKAAHNIVATGHFEMLVKLNGDIDAFLVKPITRTAPPDESKLDKAIVVITGMKDLMAFGLTKFDAKQWQEVEGQDKMRLRPNQQREEAATKKGLL